jgi:class 3 adenylate cyclase
VSGSPASPEDPLSRSLQRLLPPQYVDKLIASRGAVEGERRVVTILFSDVKGSTAMAENLDPEEVLEIMNGAFEVLIEPITRHEGTLARLMGDAIMAFFGAPIAHEDDPSRACRAALEIIEGIRAYAAKLESERNVKGFNVRVGINTGLVVVAEVGADLRVEYTAMGDAVNLAARMETAAEPGTILLTSATQELIGEEFETEALGPLQLKGKSHSVETFRLLRPRGIREGKRPGRGLRAPLTGRRAEMNQLRSRLRALAGGEGGIVSLIGETGAGKTRLMEEARRGFSQSLRWAEARSYAYTEGMSYWTLRGLLYSLLGIRTGPDALAPASVAARSLLRTMRRSPEVAQYLSIILGDENGKDPGSGLRDLPPEVLIPRVIQALREFLRLTSSKQPLTLVLDDLQWIDPSSLSVLESVLPLVEEHPIQFQFLFRPGADRALAFHHRVRERFAQRHLVLTLGSLPAGDAAALLDRLLAGHTVPADTRRLVLDRTEGNPLFMEETVRQVLHASRDGTAGRADLALPNTLRGAIMARIDSLPQQERRTLQTASVLGRIFSCDRLQ